MREGTFFAAGKVIITLYIVMSALVLGVFLCISGDSPFWRILLSITIIMSFVIAFPLLLKSKIRLNEKGIIYHSKKLTVKMSWAEIGKVDIFQGPRGYFKFIGFCRSVDGKIWDTYLKNSTNYICVGYNKKVIRIIENYWDKEIQNLNGLVLK